MKHLPVYLACLALLGGEAGAVTVDGTIVTNVASATFGSPSGLLFQVSYCATATFLVSSPNLGFRKDANATMEASGGTVTFTLWVVNQSNNQSAFNVTVTDRLPDQMVYLGSDDWNDGTGETWYYSRSANNTAWAAGAATAGQEPPYYLRWAIYRLGIGQSACVRYWARVM